MSDSDDDDDPFHNKAAGLGFSPPRSVRADSIAGKSRATSTTKAGAPANVPGAPAGAKG